MIIYTIQNIIIMAKQIPIPTPGELRRRYAALHADAVAGRIADILHTDPPTDPCGIEWEACGEYPGLERMIFLEQEEISRRRQLWHCANRRTRLAERISRELVSAPNHTKERIDDLRHRLVRRARLPLRRYDLAGEIARCVRLHLKSNHINLEGVSTSYEARLSAERADGRRIELGELTVRTTREGVERAIRAWREEGVDRERWSPEIELFVPTSALTQRIVAESVARFIVDALAWQRGCPAILVGAWPTLVFDDEWEEDSDSAGIASICEAELESLGQSPELLGELREIGINLPALHAGERVAEVDYRNPSPEYYRHGILVERILPANTPDKMHSLRRWRVAFDDGMMGEVGEDALVVFDRPPLVLEVVEGRVSLAARLRALSAE